MEIRIDQEDIKRFCINTETNLLTIEYSNKSDKKAISKVVLKIVIDEVKSTESYHYL